MDCTAIAEATWPAARKYQAGPWTIREGQGGGKRVSAASPVTAWQAEDIGQAEANMRALGQDRLFMLRPEDDALDAALAQRGYQMIDPVWIYSIAAEALAAPLPHATSMPVWPPLAIQNEIWEAGGIGTARLAVMQRAEGPKTSLLGRTQDQPGGTAFAAIHQGCVMLHAIEVAPHMRRKGVARNLIQATANWALSEGATELALLVTKANAPANALYQALGMRVVGQYHYRLKSD